MNFIDIDGRLGHVAAACAVGALWVGTTSAAISGMQGKSLWCSLKAGFGGAVGGCVGGVLGSACRFGGLLCGAGVNGLGNMATGATDMLTGVRDAPSGLRDFGRQMGNAFEDGALAGAMTSPGARSGSKVIDDFVENVATTATGSAIGGLREWLP